jgi:hypothetical protein
VCPCNPCGCELREEVLRGSVDARFMKSPASGNQYCAGDLAAGHHSTMSEGWGNV